MMMEMIDEYNDGDDGDNGDDVPVMLMMQCNQIFFPSPPCSPQLHPIYRDTRKLHFSGFQSFFSLLSGDNFSVSFGVGGSLIRWWWLPSEDKGE